MNAPENRAPVVKPTTSEITSADRWDHWLARWGYRRSEHRVEPGIYALGAPTPDSPVFVTANYTLSFDALRSSLAGIPSYILVLDTLGINVWCAAGKGTFGTEELMRRIRKTRLDEVVEHRKLILPQLGASGVSAHAVREGAGWQVRYGPVRAEDIPEFLRTGRVSDGMRRVRFDLRDRAVLIPIELVGTCKYALVGVTAAYLLEGTLGMAALGAALVAGTVLFPLLLPVLPTQDFSSKGFLLGGLAAAPFAIALQGKQGLAGWRAFLGPTGWLLSLSSVTAFLALNFTGATTFASPSGVRREMRQYIRWMAGAFGLGVLAMTASALCRGWRGARK